MYLILLSILKAASEVVTVGFGIWGLFFPPESKIETKIVRHRRIAAIGILTGLIFSLPINYVETTRAVSGERAHTQEIRRLLQPLGAMSISLTFQVDKQKKASGAVKDLREFLAGLKQSETVRVNHHDLPVQLRDRLTVAETIEQTEIALYHNPSCDPKPGFVHQILGFSCTSALQKAGTPFGLTIRTVVT